MNCTALLPPSLVEAEEGSAHVGEVESMFTSVCDTPTFQTLIATWGTWNFSLESYANGAGLQFANFTETWASWSTGGIYYADETYWAGNITSGEVTGPFASSWPVDAYYGPGGCSGCGLAPGELSPASNGGPAAWAIGLSGVLCGTVAVGAALIWRRRRRGWGGSRPAN